REILKPRAIPNRKCRLRDQELPSPLTCFNNCVYLKYRVFVWGVC
ncbi:hypothetical protein HMPREF1586_01398, partial [Gardnerella vaginalis JCP8522]